MRPVSAITSDFATRVKLKLARIARDLNPAEREFRRHWSKLNELEGWLLPAEAAWLFHAARGLPANANIVEIGSFKGRSTCCLALGSRIGHKRVFAIDSFDGGPDLPKTNSFPDFMKNLERFEAGHVEPIVGLSRDVAKNWSKPINLLFIDGSHEYGDVLADFKEFFPFVVPGGIVAFHDVNQNWPGVLRAFNDIEDQLAKVGSCESLAHGRKPGAFRAEFK